MAEKKHRMSPERWVILGLLVVLVSMFAGFSIASAVVDNSDGTANACYSPKNGKLRLATSACKAGKEVATTLNRSVPMFAKVAADGTLGANKHAISSIHFGTGAYVVTFDRAVNNCAYAVTPSNPSNGDAVSGVAGPDFGSATTQVGVVLSSDAGADVDLPFSLTVTC